MAHVGAPTPVKTVVPVGPTGPVGKVKGGIAGSVGPTRLG
ncbi:hypothetical protein bcere0028_19840 [Bacillus cereus AH1271]|nr:hypothetical protein bcere0028_19840 [Bacillus cereus AH1271]